MARFRDNERQVVVAPIYQTEGVKVDRQRCLTTTNLFPDVEVWRSWSFRLTLGGTRYVRYGEHSYTLAPGTVFWSSPVCEPVTTSNLPGVRSDTIVLTFSLQRWRLLTAQQPLFGERNASLLNCYPAKPILALQVAPPHLLYVLQGLLRTAATQPPLPTVQENAFRLLLSLIGELRFFSRAQHIDQAQRRRVEAAQRRIAASLADPPNLAVLADELAISLRQLQRDFLAVTGLGPVRYRNILRLSEANTLLADTSLPVATIAAQLGYASVAHFSAAFRQLYHGSPGEVRGLISRDEVGGVPTCNV